MRKPLRNQTIEVVVSEPIVDDIEDWPVDNVAACLLERASDRRWLPVLVKSVDFFDSGEDDDDVCDEAAANFLRRYLEHPVNEMRFEVNARRMIMMIVNK